jgi:hypothetical protein
VEGSNKTISIGITQTFEGWHVAVWVNDKILRQSPALANKKAAQIEAKKVAREFENRFPLAPHGSYQ